MTEEVKEQPELEELKESPATEDQDTEPENIVFETEDQEEPKEEDKQEVVDPKVINASPDYTPEQDAIIQKIFSHIAYLIPQYGRDYTMSVSFGDGEGEEATVTLNGLTQMGAAWVRALRKYFNETDNTIPHPNYED